MWGQISRGRGGGAGERRASDMVCCSSGSAARRWNKPLKVSDFHNNLPEQETCVIYGGVSVGEHFTHISCRFGDERQLGGLVDRSPHLTRVVAVRRHQLVSCNKHRNEESSRCSAWKLQCFLQAVCFLHGCWQRVSLQGLWKQTRAVLVGLRGEHWADRRLSVRLSSPELRETFGCETS